MALSRTHDGGSSRCAVRRRALARVALLSRLSGPLCALLGAWAAAGCGDADQARDRARDSAQDAAQVGQREDARAPDLIEDADDSALPAVDATGAAPPEPDPEPPDDGIAIAPDASTAMPPDPACPACPEPAAPAWDLCGALAARAGVTLSEGPEVSWMGLLCELVDLDRFTHPAQAAYTAHLASSHDRSSVRERVASWFANNDFSNYVREDADEHVMMESRTPGVVTRIWSPNPNGELRIYIDDERVPAVRARMSDFLAGRYAAPFKEPFTFYSGNAEITYFPIPYARYARIATTSDDLLFYQVNYREYETGTRVEPYSTEQLAALEPMLAQVGRVLREPAQTPGLAALPVRELSLTDAEPEQLVLAGPAVVRELTLRGFPVDGDWLRKTRIVMTVDGERSVDAPVGDLFGSGPGFARHVSLPVSSTESALSLRWPMPVKHELRVRLESNGGSIGEVSLASRFSSGVPEDYRIFHAVWTGPRAFNTEKPLDWTLLHYQGSGWYVGTMLNVANPVEEWWGEGDEKVYVDGESFPSLFGTGTEDYFGFGWCSPEVFARPWLGQTRVDGPFNWARHSSYRWHVLDAIPFASDLRFDLEVLHWNDAGPVTLTQDALSVWYAAPGGSLESRSAELSDYRVPPLNTSVEPWPYYYDCGIYAIFI